MRDVSDTAVFIALRRLADRKSIEKTLTAEDLQIYNAWKLSTSGTLTLFVDSLDEAAAGQKDSIEYLVSDLADVVTWPNERVKWVFSTRPAVLTPAVFAKLSEILGQPTSTVPSTQSTGSIDDGASTISTTDVAGGPQPYKLRIFFDGAARAQTG
ncbi:hypothetical protein LP420_04865 [Massilia sp. B-10]|nr:hypothetical protein LP420_04865 [Massilia sp. B-10]